MHIPITVNVNIEHISITSLTNDTENGTWQIGAHTSVPRNLVYDDVQWPTRVDRQEWEHLPVTLADAQMQAILGDNYAGVVTAMSLGEYKPSRAIQEAIITAVIGGLE